MKGAILIFIGLLLGGCAANHDCEFHSNNPNSSTIMYQLYLMCEGGYQDACDVFYEINSHDH